ncbi:pentapeptide repeat-containing protein [uncultured Winogradskyella sp.]|uniref:pentapeptide repeat-containing protein n=1 Tax=uncultured Winogradskyella sp. TaxID=395353 RepID=UPI0026188178|nr:pentapeptide repeat-containing protein [uncultured Winogradskyella sp.]
MIKNEKIDEFQKLIYNLDKDVKHTEKHTTIGRHISSCVDDVYSDWKINPSNINPKPISGHDRLSKYLLTGDMKLAGLHAFIIYFFYNIQKDFSNNIDERVYQLKKLETLFEWIDIKKTKGESFKGTQILINTLLKKIDLFSIKAEIGIKWRLAFLQENKGKWMPVFKESNVFSFSKSKKTSESRPEVQQEKPLKKETWIRTGLIVLGILIVVYFGYNYLEKQSQLKEQALEEERILSNATMLHSGYSSQLNQLYKTIEEELKKGDNVLSKTTIDKIISLSGNLKPYRYLYNQKLLDTPLSRERADLFRYLIQLKLSNDTYRKIFDKADFSYGDFSNIDLSNINLIRFIEGIQGNHGKNAKLLIATFNRPNLKESLFENCNLTGAKLFADFSGADFRNAIVTNTLFYWSRAVNANFSGSQRVIEVVNSDFKNTNFQNDTIYGSFIDSDLRGAIFNNSMLLPYNLYNDAFTDMKTIGNKPIDTYSETTTFHNSFLGSKEIYSRYRYSDFKFGKNKYAANSFFNEEYKSLEGTWVHDFYNPVQVFLSPSQKEIPFLDKNFRLIGKNYSLPKYIENWKSEESTLVSYTVRTNDNYYSEYAITHYLNYLWKDKVIQSSDTIFISSGKDFYCYGLGNIDNMKCPERVVLENHPLYASFENCKFYNVSFSSKINGVSFKGSTFQKLFFKDSRLYDIDMRLTTGDVYFDKTTMVDSILIDESSFFNKLHSEKQKLLETKVNYPIMSNDMESWGKKMTFEEYINDKKLNTLPIAVYGQKKDIRTKFEFIEDMEKRLIFIDDKNHFYLKDSLYLKLLNFKKQVEKKKSP